MAVLNASAITALKGASSNALPVDTPGAVPMIVAAESEPTQQMMMPVPISNIGINLLKLPLINGL